MSDRIRSRFLSITLGLTLVITSWIGLGLLPWFSSPSIYSPVPALTVIPALLIPAHLQKLAVLIPTVLFFLWNPSLICAPKPNIPRRTSVLLALLTILTIVDFIFEWRYAVEYHGPLYAEVFCVIELGWLLFMWSALIFGWCRPSTNKNIVVHYLIFLWLSWYAFPWLDEVP